MILAATVRPPSREVREKGRKMETSRGLLKTQRE